MEEEWTCGDGGGGRYRKTAMRGAHGGVMGNEVRRGRVMACALRGGLL